MAADPKQIVSSLSLASREAGRPRGRVEGNWWVLLPWSSHQVTRRRSHHFPLIALSGFWVSGVAVLAVLAVGAGHVNQISLRGERGGELAIAAPVIGYGITAVALINILGFIPRAVEHYST